MNPAEETVADQIRRQRAEFYQSIDGENCTPLWEIMRNLVTAEPNTPCLPYLWKWDQMWPRLQESADLITAEEAERRVLVLENPGLRGRTRITHSLYAGLQIILPGEVASAHRHSQSALRFILHGDGAYTAVNGERVAMHVGDFVITPSWSFHDHGNPSSGPMVWLDGLDIPIVELLDAQFREEGSEQIQPISHAAETNLARFGNSLKPISHVQRSKTSPMFWYPYERTRETLKSMEMHDVPHACWGHKVQYLNPITGLSAMPTIGSFMQLLPKGFRGITYRSTDSTVYAVVEGHGRCIIDDHVMVFGPRDVFVCPSWLPYQLEADERTVLFSYSDRPVQQALDLWQERF